MVCIPTGALASPGPAVRANQAPRAAYVGVGNARPALVRGRRARTVSRPDARVMIGINHDTALVRHAFVHPLRRRYSRVLRDRIGSDRISILQQRGWFLCARTKTRPFTRCSSVYSSLGSLGRIPCLCCSVLERFLGLGVKELS